MEAQLKAFLALWPFASGLLCWKTCLERRRETKGRCFVWSKRRLWLKRQWISVPARLESRYGRGEDANTIFGAARRRSH